MADSTKIPIVADAADPATHRAGEAAVPGRPAWMKSSAVKAAGRRRAGEASVSPVLPRAEAEDGDTGTPLPLATTHIGDWLRSAAARAYSASFVLHLLLLLGMALWLLPHIKESRSITTVINSDVEAPQPFDAMDDVQLEMPAGSEDIIIPQLTEAVLQDSPLNVLEHQFLEDVTAADTQGEGGSSDIGKGGFRLLEPKNAVKAGSFTAWTIPIPHSRYPDRTKAGDSPGPGQNYHIVIQVKVPEHRTNYSISDLSGKVIGTDGYMQIIPAQAYIQQEDGKMVRANIGRRVPIVDGVVQILILVPGAEAMVKDTISIKSKLLKENQTLDLIFGKLQPERRGGNS